MKKKPVQKVSLSQSHRELVAFLCELMRESDLADKRSPKAEKQYQEAKRLVEQAPC